MWGAVRVNVEVQVKKLSAAIFFVMACQNPQGDPVPNPPLGIKSVSEYETAVQVDPGKLKGKIDGAQPITLEEEVPAPTSAPDPSRMPTTPEESVVAAASHILIQYQGAERSTATRTKEEAKARIDKILLLARSQGASFKELAKYSDEPNAALSGGALGLFNRDGAMLNAGPGGGRLVSAFTDTTFSIKEGQISDPVETEFGYHIILREPTYVLAQIPILFKSEGLPPDMNITRTKEEAQARAKEVSDKIKAGLSFTDASKTYSDAPFAVSGNIISELMIDGELGPKFEQVKSLDISGIADPIEIEVGYLIVQKQPTAFGYASHILVTYKDSEFSKATGVSVTRTKEEAKKRIEEAAKKVALPGAKFEDLAKTYSDDPSSKERGGDLGEPLVRGLAPSIMVEPVVSMPIGGISSIVETPYGFHIFKRTPKPAPTSAPTPAPTTPPM
jgi:NIMA-interacting peptidyl-prolyl cis-trans isomerase 1